MQKIIKIEEEFTQTELAHIYDAIISWETTINNELDKENDKAEKSSKVCLFGRSFGSSLVHDIKLKLNLGDHLKGKEVFSINNK